MYPIHQQSRRETIPLTNGSLIKTSLLPICFGWNKSHLEYYCKGKKIKMPKGHINKFELDPPCSHCGFRGVEC